MKLDVNTVALVTGGASGLGLASAQSLRATGSRVVVADLRPPAESGDFDFVECDVTDGDSVGQAVAAAMKLGPLRAVVHTAGVGAELRLVDDQGNPADPEIFDRVVKVNLYGTFHVLRHAAAAMATLPSVEGERGVLVQTASVAAFEGRIGHSHYAASKGAVVAMTLPAARDLASREIRVCTIAPGAFHTPILDVLSERERDLLAADVPHPNRLGRPGEFASLVMQIVDNQMLNGETIRLDGALRMSPAPPPLD